MKVKLKGEIEIKPTSMQLAIEERLAKYVLPFNIDVNNELYFEVGCYDQELIKGSTSDKNPCLKYLRKIHAECETLNQFVCKFNNYDHQTECIDIRFPFIDELVSATFYGGKFVMFYTGHLSLPISDNFEVIFLNDAFSHFFNTKKSLPFQFAFYDSDEIIKWIEKEKRARSLPNAPNSEFQSDAINRNLVYMLVDEFARRLKQLR